MATKKLDKMKRLEKIVARLPEAVRVDIAEWGDEPTFRVNGKNFIFSDQAAEHLSVKLSKDEAAAVVATDPRMAHLKDITDVSEFDRLEIQHFFETYKDLEPGKSVEGAEWVGREEAEAPYEYPPPSQQVGQRARRQEQRGQHQRVGVHHPLQVGEAPVQVAPDARQRHVHHRDVQQQHERGRADRDQRPALAFAHEARRVLT